MKERIFQDPVIYSQGGYELKLNSATNRFHVIKKVDDDTVGTFSREQAAKDFIKRLLKKGK